MRDRGIPLGSGVFGKRRPGVGADHCRWVRQDEAVRRGKKYRGSFG